MPKKKTGLLHKCLVYWDDEEQVWIVYDRACEDFAENKSWRRAVAIAVYHFQYELSETVSRVLQK